MSILLQGNRPWQPTLCPEHSKSNRLENTPYDLAVSPFVPSFQQNSEKQNPDDALYPFVLQNAIFTGKRLHFEALPPFDSKKFIP